MLGWYISVYDTTAVDTPSKAIDRKEFERQHLIANWEAGLGGLDWIDTLVNEDKGQCLGGDGYPLRYRVVAHDFFEAMKLNQLAGKSKEVIGEDYLMPENWRGAIKLDIAKIGLVDPNNILLITAFDLS